MEVDFLTKAVVKCLFMTHSPPFTMRHLRGEWVINKHSTAYKTTLPFSAPPLFFLCLLTLTRN